MAERFIFTWKDETEEARFKAMAAFEGVTMSEMMHRVIAQIPVIGKIPFKGKISDLKSFDHALTPAEIAKEYAEQNSKIPSSGLEMFDRIDKLFADKKPHVRLVDSDGEVVEVEEMTTPYDEIVGSDKGWE